MLNDLKKALREDGATNFGLDAILESTVSVKDAFLDDPEIDLIGAEDDPEIRDLIETIPEYGGNEDDIEDGIEALTEGLTGTATRPGAHTADDLRGQIDRIKVQNEKLHRELEFYKKRANNHQMQIIRTSLNANDKKIGDLESQLKSL